MAHQSPMVSIPRKSTDEVDWTTPIRNLIAQSYGEGPDNYATECASLQRCRQDAVRGAGSDSTARDLLYKYFGQLELLELRFSEIRVTFPWRDAFTNKLTTQTSIAFEKASILFQIAGTHSAIAASQSRSDPEGIKRAFYYFKTCAGMLTYINDNFLHAPSTDLSREVVKFLVAVILAQATEVFFEKCTDEKKNAALVSKVGSQAASMYTALVEHVKEFMGKGIFDRNWVTLIQVKAKYFVSLSNFYRGMADDAAGKHGDALARYTIAETNAKEASRLAGTFNSAFVSTLSPTLPSDAGSSLVERMKAHLSLCTDRKAEATRENDLIYNAVLPNPESLPAIEKFSVATPVPIQEVYGTPEVQKTIGPDIFIRLVPLSVHESASVYSEEKAKLVRGEVEKSEGAEGEARSALDMMGVKDGLTRFRAMAEGEVGGEDEVPIDVRRWKEDISLIEGREPVETLLGQLARKKETVKKELDEISKELELESRDCEMMRVKYDHKWTQNPSAGYTKSFREELKSHFGSLEAAASSDGQVMTLWNAVRQDIGLLMSRDVEDVFRASTERGAGSENLLDLDVGADGDDSEERSRIGGMVSEIDERLGKLNKISRERSEILKDLKEKIQTDDVSHLLLLNRRNSSVEPALFAAELEKFRPYQQRLSATFHHQEGTLQEIGALWKKLREIGSRGAGARKWDEREKRKKETVMRFSRAREGYMEVRDGLAKGLNFYNELTDLAGTLRRNVKSYVSGRATEREGLVRQLEVEKRLSFSGSAGSGSAPPPLAAKPPLPPPPPSTDLSSSMASMKLHSSGPPTQWRNTPTPPTGPSAPTASSYSHSSPAAPPGRSGTGGPGQRQPSYFPPPPTQPSSSQPTYPSSPAPAGLPPPPPPIHQSSYSYQRPEQSPQPPSQYGGNTFSSPPPPRPPTDPYGSLGMFNSSTPPPPPPQQHQQQYPYGSASAPPLPPSQQPQQQQQQQQQQQSAYQNYQQPSQQQYTGYGPPPPQQQQPNYGAAYGSPPSPQQQQSSFGGYGSHQGGYQGFPPPPPQQQQQYGGYGPGR